MSGRSKHVDRHNACAIAFKLGYRDASIPEVMGATLFMLTNSSNPAKQMMVNHACEKAISGTPPPQSNQGIDSWDVNGVISHQFAIYSQSKKIVITSISINLQHDSQCFVLNEVKA